ncbi:nicotinate-nucleotide--dimethylbenzimidazole phosphoribosyltransferase [Rarispira pelagica]
MTIEKIENNSLSPIVRDAVQKRLDMLTKPQGSLGVLEELVIRLALIQDSVTPVINKKYVFVFAADHGVAKEGVSAYPQEVTAQMVYNFLAGGAAINALSKRAGAEVVVVDAGVAHDFSGCKGLIDQKVVYGSHNMTESPAMSREEAIKCIVSGIELAEEYEKKGINLAGVGEMGIANTTAASAVTAILCKLSPTVVTGKGTGIDENRLEKKVNIVKKAIEINAPDVNDPLDVLSKVGGAEIGQIAGFLLGCAALRIPVITDGFIATSGALIAQALCPALSDFLFASHVSQEPGHIYQLKKLGLSPLFDLGLRLGEGTGTTIAMQLMDSALEAYYNMASFQQAGVSEKEE